MRAARKRPGYPSVEYASATVGERLVYGYAAGYAAIVVFTLIAVAMTFATGHASRYMFLAFAGVLLIGSFVLAAALVVRRRHLRRKRERAELLVALEAEIAE